MRISSSSAANITGFYSVSIRPVILSQVPIGWTLVCTLACARGQHVYTYIRYQKTSTELRLRVCTHRGSCFVHINAYINTYRKQHQIQGWNPRKYMIHCVPLGNSLRSVRIVPPSVGNMCVISPVQWGTQLFTSYPTNCKKIVELFSTFTWFLTWNCFIAAIFDHQPVETLSSNREPYDVHEPENRKTNTKKPATE